MNYQKIALAALLSVGVLFSCKKKDDTPEETTPVTTTTGATPAPTTYKIKTEKVSNSGASTETTYEYDSNGRVTKMTHSDGSFSTVEWSSGKCVQKEFDNGATTPISTTTFDLNASGQCTSQSDDSGTTTTYEYNSEGYQTKMTSSGSGQTSVMTFVVNNGNQSSMSTSISGINMTMNMDYFTDKTNTTGNVNKGMSIFGKDNKNLIKSMSTSFMGQSISMTFTYEFDSKNRVTKMTQTQTSSGTSSSSTTTYTYVD